MRLDGEVGSVPRDEADVGDEGDSILELHRSLPVVDLVDPHPHFPQGLRVGIDGDIGVGVLTPEPIMDLGRVEAVNLLGQEPAAGGQDAGDLGRVVGLVPRHHQVLALVGEVEDVAGIRVVLQDRDVAGCELRSRYGDVGWPSFSSDDHGRLCGLLGERFQERGQPLPTARSQIQGSDT